MTDEEAPHQTPALTYWHVFTDERGLSTQRRGTLTAFGEESMGGDADPQFNLHFGDERTHVTFAELPADWVGEWHENPKPQWIIPLSGGWWVETQDGQRVEMRAGDISFGADQNTRENAQGNKGHRSGSLDGAPCKMMIVQLLDDKYVGAKPGELPGS